ncbi:MAG TPA: neutral zinc metallopeptidase [Casimicrobiaceae bacterium]|nr:neutral zinc metallopeptidase [Casimicrobiaceae bacterium]
MRWGDMRQSENVEDVTGGQSGGGGGFGGGGMKLGGGAMILVVIVSLLFGVNPLQFLGMMDGGAPPAPIPAPSPKVAPPGYGPQAAKGSDNPDKALSARVLGDTEDVWTALFQAMGSRYEPPRLVLFSRTTTSACGRASSASGPFYCPADRKLYLDTEFFRELQGRFGAPGDFAQAYVIAHEVGHHVQNLMGTMGQYDQAAGKLDERRRNALSVRLELQADCYAGVWGFYAAKRNLLEPGDAQEGLRAASAVGDDSIQKMSRGYVVPEGFTHGSAEQRMKWFQTGLQSGDPRACNTFAAKGA